MTSGANLAKRGEVCFPLFVHKADGADAYFTALTSPDISSSTFTTGFTFRRKLLGFFIPHAMYGTSRVQLSFLCVTLHKSISSPDILVKYSREQDAAQNRSRKEA